MLKKKKEKKCKDTLTGKDPHFKKKKRSNKKNNNKKKREEGWDTCLVCKREKVTCTNWG